MTRAIRGLVTALLVGLAPLAAACSDGAEAPEPVVARDGTPRIPDDQGVLTAADPKAKRITIDGERTYDLAENFVSFSTYTPRAAEPLVGRLNQYVLVGLEGGQAAWMAGVGAVVPVEPRSAYYVGALVRIDGRRAIFRDGTVLDLADGVADPGAGSGVRARIDVATHRVVELSFNGRQ